MSRPKRWARASCLALFLLVGCSARNPPGGTEQQGASEAATDVGASSREEQIAGVKSVVSRNFGQLGWCYEQQLKADPDLAGRVEMLWNVSGGKVTSVETHANTSGNAALGDCIAKKIRRWKFPEQVEGEVIYPFIFKPKE